MIRHAPCRVDSYVLERTSVFCNSAVVAAAKCGSESCVVLTLRIRYWGPLAVPFLCNVGICRFSVADFTPSVYPCKPAVQPLPLPVSLFAAT